MRILNEATQAEARIKYYFNFFLVPGGVERHPRERCMVRSSVYQVLVMWILLGRVGRVNCGSDEAWGNREKWPRGSASHA